MMVEPSGLQGEKQKGKERRGRDDGAVYSPWGQSPSRRSDEEGEVWAG